MPSVPHEMLVELLATSPQLLPLLGARLDALAEADASLRCGQATTSQLPVPRPPCRPRARAVPALYNPP